MLTLTCNHSPNDTSDNVNCFWISRLEPDSCNTHYSKSVVCIVHNFLHVFHCLLSITLMFVFHEINLTDFCVYESDGTRYSGW